MLGSDDRRREEAKEEREKERMHRMHSQALSGTEGERNKAEILSQLSEIDDLPIGDDDPVLGQLTSQIASTTNLSEEDVRSEEWVFEYIRLLDGARYPPSYGITADRRAWVYDNMAEYRLAQDNEDSATAEAFVDNAKRALTRSEGAKVIEESTRTVNESVVRDESDRKSVV
jgi:hypothetical protein